ncbi:hypothetical protein ACN47E_002595 [Coniothyrium glycines]
MVYTRQGYLKTEVDMQENPKAVDKAKSNLPLPEEPPAASDWNSADARTVNVGTGGHESDISYDGALREPAIGDAGHAGREARDGLKGIPNDAVTRDQRHHPGLEQTTHKDFGHHKDDEAGADGKK